MWSAFIGPDSQSHIYDYTTYTNNCYHAYTCMVQSSRQQMTGVEAGIKPLMVGGTLRRKKPPVAPPQEKQGADVRPIL